MSHSKLFACAGSAALMLAVASSAQAVQIYGFNSSSINGFTKAFQSASGSTVTQSTTTGVSEGTGALRIHVGTSTAFTQTDAFTSTVPADLIAPTTTSDQLSVTTNYNDSNFLFITQIFFLEGTRPDPDSPGDVLNVDKKLIPVNIDNNPLSPAGTATPATLTFNLKNYTDPYGDENGFGTSALFTPGEILAHNQAFFAGSNLSLPTFGFEVFNGASTGVDFYIDNVSVAGVPEPMSLGVVAAGGLLMARRRR